MGRYHPEDVHKRIDAFLKGAETPRDAAAPVDGVVPPPAPVIRPDFTRQIEELLDDLYQHAGVDSVPHGTRLSFLKRALLLVLRPLTRRQATFNYQVARIFREHVTRLEDMRALAEIQSHQTAQLAGIATSLKQLAERLDGADGDLRLLADNHQQTVEDLRALLGKLDELRTAHDTLAGEHQDHATELAALDQHLETLTERQEQQATDLAALERRFFAADESIAQHRTTLDAIDARAWELAERLKHAEARLRTAIDFRAEVLDRLASTTSAEINASPSPAPDLDALAATQFQELFRGTEADLRQRLAGYADQLVAACEGDETARGRRVVDLATGEGVLVELLSARGFDALGVDANAVAVTHGRDAGRRLEQADVFAWLAAQPPASVDAITCCQFIEHLEIDQLLVLLRGVHRVLRPSGVVLFETINPHTLAALQWYFRDLTHRHLVFPEVLGTLLEAHGFHVEQWQGTSEVPEHERLAEEAASPARENTRKLNQLLFGAQDYWLLARKGHLAEAPQ